MRDALDRALGPTPQSFCDRMDDALLSLKEEQQVKRIALRTVVVAVMVAALAVSTACALLSQGLTWYYENRFTAYQQYEPEKHEAILRNMEQEVPQTAPDDPEVTIRITETSWLPDNQLLVVMAVAQAKEPGVALYPMGCLDTDGVYVGEGGDPAPEADGEDRAVHWLWTREGFGPVEEMTGGQRLLLLTANEIWWEDVRLLGDNSSYDEYVDENGVAHSVMHLELKEMLSPDWEAIVQARIDAGQNTAYWQRRREEIARFRQALDASPDGVMTLRLSYTVTPYTEDDTHLYGGGRTGDILFEIKMK